MITKERQKDRRDRSERLSDKAKAAGGIRLQEQTGMSLRLFLLLAVTILAVILVMYLASLIKDARYFARLEPLDKSRK